MGDMARELLPDRIGAADMDQFVRFQRLPAG
jgi:hypothetical protein